MRENVFVLLLFLNAVLWAVAIAFICAYRKEAREMRLLFLKFSQTGAEYYHNIFDSVGEMCEIIVTSESALAKEIMSLKGDGNAKVQIETDNN